MEGVGVCVTVCVWARQRVQYLKHANFDRTLRLAIGVRHKRRTLVSIRAPRHKGFDRCLALRHLAYARGIVSGIACDVGFFRPRALKRMRRRRRVLRWVIHRAKRKLKRHADSVQDRSDSEYEVWSSML